MKWYCVKKYKPSIVHCMYLVRISCGEIHVATLEGLEYPVWISDDKKYFDDYPVTHFAIPDPIEIEE